MEEGRWREWREAGGGREGGRKKAGREVEWEKNGIK